MRPILTALAAAAALLALAGGCASSGSATHTPAGGTAASVTPAQQQALARYLAYAGPPIPYFIWLGHLYSWEPLGKDQLVVLTTTDEAYLLKVWPPCDLRFGGIGVGITSRTNTVYARVDSVTTGRMRCPIDEIRKIDYPRMQAELHQQVQTKQPAQQNKAAP